MIKTEIIFCFQITLLIIIVKLKRKKYSTVIKLEFILVLMIFFCDILKTYLKLMRLNV